MRWNVASVWQTLTKTSRMIARVWLIDSKTVIDLFYSKRPRVREMWRFSQMNAHAYMPSTLCQYLLLRIMWNKTRLKQWLSLTAGRQISEIYLTRTITGSKSLGKSFGTTLWHQVQRYCFLGIYFVHAQCRWDWFFSVYVGKISAWCHLNTRHLLVSGVSVWG